MIPEIDHDALRRDFEALQFEVWTDSTDELVDAVRLLAECGVEPVRNSNTYAIANGLAYSKSCPAVAFDSDKKGMILYGYNNPEERFTYNYQAELLTYGEMLAAYSTGCDDEQLDIDAGPLSFV